MKTNWSVYHLFCMKIVVRYHVWSVDGGDYDIWPVMWRLHCHRWSSEHYSQHERHRGYYKQECQIYPPHHPPCPFIALLKHHRNGRHINFEPSCCLLTVWAASVDPSGLSCEVHVWSLGEKFLASSQWGGEGRGCGSHGGLHIISDISAWSWCSVRQRPGH